MSRYSDKPLSFDKLSTIPIDARGGTPLQALPGYLEKLKAASTIKPLKVVTSEEDREAGAPDEFEVPITFDQSNFFG